MAARKQDIISALGPYIIRYDKYYLMFEHEVERAKARLFAHFDNIYARVVKGKSGMMLVVGNTGNNANRPLVEIYLIDIVKEEAAPEPQKAENKQMCLF